MLLSSETPPNTAKLFFNFAVSYEVEPLFINIILLYMDSRKFQALFGDTLPIGTKGVPTTQSLGRT
jgi:hypothetical protein